MAGANSVFLGDRLLTTPNPTADVDRALFERLGLRLQVRAGYQGHKDEVTTKVTKDTKETEHKENKFLRDLTL
jgi:biotin synthase